MVAQGHYVFPQFIHWTLETGCRVRMLQWGYLRKYSLSLWYGSRAPLLFACIFIKTIWNYVLSISLIGLYGSLTHSTGSWVVEIEWLIDSNDKSFSLSISLIGLYGWLLLPSLDWRGNHRTEEQIQSSFDSF